MRILMASWRGPGHPLAGGAEQVSHEHSKGWIRYGHSVTLFTSAYNHCQNNETLDGVKIIRRGYQYLGVQIAFFFYYLRHSQEFDLIIDQFHGIPFFTPLFVRQTILALIQETAGEVWLLNKLPKPLNWVIGQIGYHLEPACFWLYKHTVFMTGSASAKNDVIKMGIPAKNIHIIPHGVIVPKMNAKTKEKTFTVCYLGILSKDKGIEDAINCFSRLRSLGKFQFWVIGQAESAQYGLDLQELVQKLGQEKQIKFWGYVSQAKKYELLSRAWVLLNPSIREGWGLVNIEANYCGLPVVAYAVAGITDSVRNKVTGLLSQKGDLSGLVDNVQKLSLDTALYKNLQRQAKLWSRKFSWENSIKLSLSLLHNVYGRN